MSRPRAAVLGLSGGIVVLLLIQLIPVDRTNPDVTSDVQAPTQVQSILRRACYDCHSNETVWPWYSRVAPVSWRVTGHVREGRKDLNFSEWPAFDFELQDLEFEEIRDQVEQRRMPPQDYLMMHPDARLSAADRRTLIDWATPIKE